MQAIPWWGLNVIKNIPATLSLFTSASTLICCALPAVIVTVAGGAALAGLVSNYPQLIWLSEHKVWLFSIAGMMLLAAGFIQYKNRNAPCPIDVDAATACMRLRLINAIIFWISVLMYLTGFTFAFVAPYFI